MAKAEPESQHLTDAFIQPFLQTDFDPADYLNRALPNPSFSTTTTKSTARAAAFTDLSTQMQTLLTQMNANTTRLSNTLTQLTDEIIRSGSRLAYEVEVLRGETLSLSDALSTSLKPDLDLLAPPPPVAAAPLHPSDPTTSADRSSAAEAEAKAAVSTAPTATGANPSTENPTSTGPTAQSGAEAQPQDPEFLTRLRTLTTVRERLDAVIKIFGAAMAWPIAPSELSLASAFISVSAPESGESGGAGGVSREERAKAYAENLRREIADMLAAGPEGVEAARARVAELRVVAEVWKGTAEEKARLRLVDGLQKLVDDKVKALERAGGMEGRKLGTANLPARGMDYRYGGVDDARLTGEGVGGYGFLQNLRNLKNEVYLD